MPWKCEHGHVHGIEPEPCWMCQLEQSNRELADENRSLRDQLQVADEQCHQQVADAVKAREEALQQVKRLEKANLRLVVEMDDLLQTIQDQAEIIERLEARR